MPALYNHSDPRVNEASWRPRQGPSGLEVTGQWFLENVPTLTFSSVSLHVGGMVLGPPSLKFPVYAVVICETLSLPPHPGGLSAHGQASSYLAETVLLASPLLV